MIRVIVMLCICTRALLHLAAVSTFTLHKPPLLIGQDRAGQVSSFLLGNEIVSFHRPSLIILNKLFSRTPGNFFCNH